MAFTDAAAIAAGLKPVSCIIIDTKKFGTSDAAKLTALKEKLYGTAEGTPTLPTPDQMYTWATTGSFPA